MQLQQMRDGHYAWIREVLTKGPLAQWLKEEESKLLTGALQDIQDYAFQKALWDDEGCPRECRGLCDDCERFIQYAEWGTKGWLGRN